MKRIRSRRHRILIVAGVVVVAFLILVLVSYLVLDAGSELSQGGIYRYGSATIVVDGYWKTSSTPGYVAVFGYFPCLGVSVSSTEDCSLYLKPMMRYTDGSTRQNGVAGGRISSPPAV